MPQRILLIEDQASLVMTLGDRLEAEGYEVESAGDGESGLERALSGGHDLILLDLMLPKKSGLDVCRELRAAGMQTPVLMLTAKGQVVDKVVGLQLGADDYLTKPFDMAELVARVAALLRRSGGSKPAAGPFRFGDVAVDLRKSEVLKAGKPLQLSAKEFQLLRYLVEHAEEMLTREELLQKVWGYDAMPSTRTVDVHMAWLRQKIEDNPKAPRHLLTMRGLGYKLTAG